MADYLQFEPDGLLAYKWSGKRQAYVRKRPKRASVLTHLRTRCDITDGTTLRNIFDAVDRYKLLKLVMSQYSWCRPLEEFHEQARQPFRPRKDEPLSFLEIYWACEVHEQAEQIKHKSGRRETIRTVDFEVNAEFHAYGPVPMGEEDNPLYRASRDGLIPYSVSYSPMWELADLPVRLNKQVSVYERFDPGRHRRDNPPQLLMTTERDFTLLEVLDAIYWDISFVGGPAENEALLGLLRDAVDEIESGKVAAIPLEQVTKRLGMETAGTGQVADATEPRTKIVLHPDVARMLGVDPDSIPLDDKEILRPEEPDDPESQPQR